MGGEGIMLGLVTGVFTLLALSLSMRIKKTTRTTKRNVNGKAAGAEKSQV